MNRSIQSIAVLSVFAALCGSIVGERYMRAIRLILGLEFIRVLMNAAEGIIHMLN